MFNFLLTSAAAAVPAARTDFTDLQQRWPLDYRSTALLNFIMENDLALKLLPANVKTSKLTHYQTCFLSFCKSDRLFTYYL